MFHHMNAGQNCNIQVTSKVKLSLCLMKYHIMNISCI